MQSFGRSLLVIGGARSGKSRHAQTTVEAIDGARIFVATAQAFDDEMTARIARHRDDRDARWQTVEAPIDLAGTIATHARDGAVLLIDCLTLWASNLLLADEDVDARLAALIDAIATSPARLVLVSNEVGMGIVPDNVLARRFRDIAGTINQRVAASVDQVRLVVAGIALTIK